VADRRLRIGYVSPDFRQHSVAYFLEPVLGAHDRAAFEIFCYAEVEKPDDVTARMQRLADHWCDTSGTTEEELARRIAAEEIDILVDLAGHTRGNRLPVFARRPAPVQVTWLGYCNTTGLDAIDYRLTDAVADPDGDETYSERLHRLPNGFLCYAPPAGTAEIAPPAALANGYVTFGSFNNLAKMTPDVVALWARILNAVPDARLLLKSRLLAEEATQDQIACRFADHGVARTRLVLLPRIETTDGHLEAYGRMDIALDPFPYNGRHAARVSTSILTRCGLEHLIAGSENAYVEKASALAGDLTALQTMGSEMRGRMTGTLCNAALITADIEAAYRDMWRTWCAG
jgi:predicted O-linked N-acetylglucosamine transferase (SPINDLY family)